MILSCSGRKATVTTVLTMTVRNIARLLDIIVCSEMLSDIDCSIIIKMSVIVALGGAVALQNLSNVYEGDSLG